MKYIFFITIVLLVQVLLKVMPLKPAADLYVIMMFAAQGVGASISSLLIGSIGLLYKKNRYLGFVLVTSFWMIMAIVGGGGLV
jgi:hypothetical protein